MKRDEVDETALRTAAVMKMAKLRITRILGGRKLYSFPKSG